MRVQAVLAVAHVMPTRQTVQLAQQMHNAHIYLAHARPGEFARAVAFRIIAWPISSGLIPQRELLTVRQTICARTLRLVITVITPRIV